MQLEFWFDPASTYAYLTAMRIESLAADAGIGVDWRPFLLGPVFQAQGWNTSPFNLYPAKGRYMVRDIERITAERGLGFRLPDPFPAYSLHAARIATVAGEAGWAGPFVRSMFIAEFDEGRDIADGAVLRNLVAAILEAGHPDAVAAAATSDATKALLRQRTEQAQAYGIFGAPTLRTPDGEMFWGDDRLEAALRWCRR